MQRERAFRTQATVCFQSASTLVVMIALLDVKALASGWFQVGEVKTEDEPGMSWYQLVRNCFKKNDRATLKGHGNQLEGAISDQI